LSISPTNSSCPAKESSLAHSEDDEFEKEDKDSEDKEEA